MAALGGVLLWLALVQPALRTLREAPARVLALEAQLQEMRQLASEVREFQATPALSIQQSGAALKAASERLGTGARLQLQGERAILTLNGVGSGPLREWLAEARKGARARPVEAQLTRTAQGFSGSVVLSLGGAP
jgi:general secretion pathway protein M